MGELINVDERELRQQDNGLQPDIFARFIAYLDASPKTVETYTRALRSLMKWLQANGITHPQRIDLLRYRDELKETKKPATVQLYMITTRLFFQWTKQEGLYPDIAEHLKGAKIDRRHPKNKALEAYQVKDVLKAVDRSSLEGARNYAMLVLMFTAGLRTIEVARANIEDMDTLAGAPVLYVQGKGRDERAEHVTLNRHAEEAIREYLKLRPEARPSDPLFVSTSNRNLGGRMTTRSISQTVKNAFLAVGLNSSKWTAHSTRHTAVTLAIDAGATLLEAQQFARHLNPATTEIYYHERNEAINPCADKVAAAIF